MPHDMSNAERIRALEEAVLALSGRCANQALDDIKERDLQKMEVDLLRKQVDAIAELLGIWFEGIPSKMKAVPSFKVSGARISIFTKSKKPRKQS